MIDEPAHRYLNPAIAEGAPLQSGALLAMVGRIHTVSLMRHGNAEAVG